MRGDVVYLNSGEDFPEVSGETWEVAEAFTDPVNGRRTHGTLCRPITHSWHPREMAFPTPQPLQGSPVSPSGGSEPTKGSPRVAELGAG
jgi:hypothetical protein